MAANLLQSPASHVEILCWALFLNKMMSITTLLPCYGATKIVDVLPVLFLFYFCCFIPSGVKIPRVKAKLKVNEKLKWSRYHSIE